MARKRTLDRRTLRDQSEAAEARERDDDQEVEEEVEEVEASDDEPDAEDDGEEAPKAKKKVVAKKKPATKRTRTKEAPRMKAVWVIMDNGSKRIKEFAYPQKAEAEAFLAEKLEEKKGTFYIQLVKEPFSD